MYNIIITVNVPVIVIIMWFFFFVLYRRNAYSNNNVKTRFSRHNWTDWHNITDWNRLVLDLNFVWNSLIWKNMCIMCRLYYKNRQNIDCTRGKRRKPFLRTNCVKSHQSQMCAVEVLVKNWSFLFAQFNFEYLCAKVLVKKDGP